MSEHDRERDAFLQGEEDFYDGVPIGDCPYPIPIGEPDLELSVQWCNGWHHGEARAARHILEVPLHPICADSVAGRALVSWVIASREDPEAKTEADQGRRTLN